MSIGINKSSLEFEVKSTLRVFPRILLWCGIHGFLIHPNYTFGIFLCGLILIEVVVNIIKMSLEKLLGKNNLWGKRPQQPDGGCGVFYNPKVKKGVKSNKQAYGIPSGHAAIVSFAALFWILIMIRNDMNEHVLSSDPSELALLILRIMGIVLLALAVSGSRILFKCHTISQVAVGIILGSLMGWGGFELATHFDSKQKKL